MANRRVSAKQRLELVEVALKELASGNDDPRGIDIGDYVAFEQRVTDALYGTLVPREKAVTNAATPESTD